MVFSVRVFGAVFTLLFLFALASLLGGCGGTAPLAPKAVELNRLGVEALAAGDLTTAEARFAVALEYHPRFVEALVNLGLTELSRGNTGRARQLFDRAARINADLPHPHHGKGVLADTEGKGKQAAEHYREALRVDPGFVPARANLGRLYFDAGMFEDARAQFLRLAEVAPKEDAGPAGLVETLWQLGRPEEAEDVLSAAERRIGLTPRLGLLRGRALLLAGDARRARAVLGRVVVNPGDGKIAALSWCALAELSDGDPAAAEARVDLALREAPHDALATRVLALVLEQRGDAAAASFRARADELVRAGSVTRRLRLR
jgi:Flp pilus assembly protein TadD